MPVEVYFMNLLVTPVVKAHDLVSMFSIYMVFHMDFREYLKVLEMFPMDFFPMYMAMEDLPVNKPTHHQNQCTWV